MHRLSRSITPQLLDVYAATQAIVNKTFKEIAVGNSASVQRTLQAGDVRPWAAAFGEDGVIGRRLVDS